MTAETKLDELRARIDVLDEQLQALISARAACAREVADVKLDQGQEADFYRPEREAEVLNRVSARNTGPLPDEEMVRLFREIMSACLALEKKLRVAYLGPEGTFTQAAVYKHFGHSVLTQPLAGTDAIFRAVDAGEANYGVVPVENSTEGIISHTLDMFLRSSLNICGEIQLRIHHHLLAADSDTKITRVLAHQQALAQCRGWLDNHYPNVELVAVGSNAEAARLAKAGGDVAAIASETAAALYGLKIIGRNIEDEPHNTTRFLVIGKQAVRPSGHDKTSLLVSVRNEPGALYKILQPIANNGISMTRIESRPSRQGLWEYVFHIDVEGHRVDAPVIAALAELAETASAVRVLGSYPKAVV